MENPSLPSFIASTSFFCISVNDEYDGKQSWLKLKKKKKKCSVMCAIEFVDDKEMHGIKYMVEDTSGV